MPTRPDPYVKRAAGDIIRADDWNEAQVRAAEALAAHDHRAGQGQPVPREGIAEKAIDGSRIDPAASVTLQALDVRGELKVNARALLAEIDGLIAGLKNALNRNGDVLRGGLAITERLAVGSEKLASARLQLGELSALDIGARNNAWTNLGWNAYFDGAWKRLDPNKPGANLHLSGDGAGQEFRFLRVEADGSALRNVAVIGSKVSAILESNLGLGTAAPNARLDVRGAIHAGGSDLYFTETGHRHTGFGNAAGYAAIENDGGDYNALMILGRSISQNPLSRAVKIYDNVTISGNLGTHGFAPSPRTGGWGGGIHTWDVEAEGTMWSRNGYQSGNRDLAENFDAVEALTPGDVVSLDPDRDGIRRSRQARDPLVLGVVSTRPGVLLGADADRQPPFAGEVPVALSGRVPCQVTDENGPIRRGDLLTAASRPGHAMRAGDAPPGTLIGKALADFDGGTGTIDVFVFVR